jgi:hypothetical protein
MQILELELAIPRLRVVVTGGTLRPLQHSLVDPLGGTIRAGERTPASSHSSETWVWTWRLCRDNQ